MASKHLIVLFMLALLAAVGEGGGAAAAAAYAACSVAYTACMGGAVAGTVGFPAIAAACYAAWTTCMSAGAALAVSTCFADDVRMMQVVDMNSGCRQVFQADAHEGMCIREARVQDLQLGDQVLAVTLDGDTVVTAVAWNTRHEADTEHMNITIKTARGIHSLVVTADHVMVTNGHLPTPSLVRAANVTVGEHVLVQGPYDGVVIGIVPVVLDHKNELVTEAGVVLANGIQVTTVCAGALLASADARAVLSIWQEKHALASDFQQPAIAK